MNTPTQEQLEQAVIDALRSRLSALEYKPGTKRAADAECHFMSGAMTAINAIYPNDEAGRLSERIPPAWIFGPLTGRSLLETQPK